MWSLFQNATYLLYYISPVLCRVSQPLVLCIYPRPRYHRCYRCFECGLEICTWMPNQDLMAAREGSRSLSREPLHITVLRKTSIESVPLPQRSVPGNTELGFIPTRSTISWCATHLGISPYKSGKNIIKYNILNINQGFVVQPGVLGWRRRSARGHLVFE